MSPALNDSHKDLKDKQRPEKRPDSLICRVKYTNTLPDIPFDPKFIHYSFGTERFIKHNATSLERNYKHDLITEPDVGVEVDLIDPSIFLVDPSAKLHPDDERLLEDDTLGSFDARRSRHHNKYVSWMRKTEYISNEHCNKVNKTEKAESRIGNKKRLLKDDDVYRDRQSQIDAIENTFVYAKEPLDKHYSKPNVVVDKVFPILPDFTLWKHPCAQVIFDDNPFSENKELDSCDRALIRGMVDESGQHFVAYFLPTEQTRQKLKRDAEDDILFSKEEVYEYFLAREYNWNVKNKGQTNYDENYFIVFRPDGAFYNELETRVRLNKRRKIGGGGAVPSLNLKTKLMVKHRDFNDSEFKAQSDRLSMLEQEIDDEEEDEEEPEGMGREDNEGLSDDDNSKGEISDLEDDQNTRLQNLRQNRQEDEDEDDVSEESSL